MEVNKFDVPEEFLHWSGDPAEDHMGPFSTAVLKRLRAS